MEINTEGLMLHRCLFLAVIPVLESTKTPIQRLLDTVGHGDSPDSEDGFCKHCDRGFVSSGMPQMLFYKRHWTPIFRCGEYYGSVPARIQRIWLPDKNGREPDPSGSGP